MCPWDNCFSSQPVDASPWLPTIIPDVFPASQTQIHPMSPALLSLKTSKNFSSNLLIALNLGFIETACFLFRFMFYLVSNIGSVRSSRRLSGTVSNGAPETRLTARRGWRVCAARRASGGSHPSHGASRRPWTPRQRSGDTAATETAPLCIHPAPSTPKTTDSLHRVLSPSLILLATNVIYSSAASS